MKNVPETLKILFVGNSFSVDTAEHLASVAVSYGVKSLHFGVLYIGGCSTRKHYHHITNDVHEYEYFENFGSAWSQTLNVSSVDAIKSDDWDYIAIQHGTADGSKYTEIEYYDKFPLLVAEIKKLAPEKAKIVFNMSWVGEPSNPHPEIVSFNGDTQRMYEIITQITEDFIAKTEDLDFVIPTGTAIQNARTSRIETLNRDGYHLSLGLGRFIASLAFFKGVTGADISNPAWMPESMNEYELAVAIESINNAFDCYYSVTNSKI